jgi:uncharacterized protein YbjT (DUF2867 family)
MATVLVTGASGALGRQVVRHLVARGHRARALGRRADDALPAGVQRVIGDIEQGSGLRAALVGVDAIIHCATNPGRAQQVDVEGTRLLLETARPHRPQFVYPSIVGVDRSLYGYYQAKRATEAVIEQGPLPWTILRATQFHDLVAWLIRSFGADTEPEVVVAGGMRFQSVDAGEVAERLVSLVESGPAGRAADFGVPQMRAIEELTAVYLRLWGRTATIRSAALAGEMYDVFRSGVNLTSAHTQGAVTWEAFLQRQFHPDAAHG